MSLHALKQETRLLRLSYPRGDGPRAELLVNRFEGVESLSKDFRFTLELLSDDAQIELDELLGKLLCVSLVLDDGTLRPFTGHVSQFKFLRTDGGTAFYEAVLVPWFEYTRLRHNNRLFHEQTLQAQTQTLLEDHGGLAKWQWSVEGEQPLLTMCTQWDESDHNYLSRRWEAAGYVYLYEHAEDGHTLNVLDRTWNLPPIPGASTIRFHQGGGSQDEDAIAHWSPLREWGAAKAVVSGFDFKNPLPVHEEAGSSERRGDGPELAVHQYTGHYGFKGRSGASALARQRMEELDARAHRFEAQGNNRRVMPGRSFKLSDHYQYDKEDDEFVVLEVHHEACNNYLQGVDEPAYYKNRFTCHRKKVPWRPGVGFNSTEPRLLAPQTAIVVGPEGMGSLHVDEYGRVKVRFHWDLDGRGTCWVRVGSQWAGGQNGMASHPRVGSEVIVQWLDGNVDRPLVTGSVHNQRYMPPWKLPEQHALTGLRSRELEGDAGNAPGGRGNHLVLDDTAGRIQAQLRSDHLASQLSLGHITRIEDHAGRQEARGQGFELRTDGHGALRAQKGLLISTEPRFQAKAHVTDMGETVQRLSQGQAQHDSLAEAAQQAKGQQAGDQDEVAKALQAQVAALKGEGGDPARGEFPEFQSPHVALSSPAGLATSVQGSTHLMSTEHQALTSGGHTSISAGKSLLASVREAVRLFACKAGMKLVAAGADIDITALKDSVNLLAKLNITHTANRITISAKEEVVINGGTSFSRWNAAGISHGTNGIWREHAAQHSLVVAASEGKPNLPQPTVLPMGQLALSHQYTGQSVAGAETVRNGSYTVTDAEGNVRQGTLDGRGTATVGGLAMGAAQIVYGKDPRDPWDAGSYFGKPDAWPPASAEAVQVVDAAPAPGVAPSSAPASPPAPSLPSALPPGAAKAGIVAGLMATGAALGSKGSSGAVQALASKARAAVGQAQALPREHSASALLGAAAQWIPPSKGAGLLGALPVQAPHAGLPTQQLLEKAPPGVLPKVAAGNANKNKAALKT